MASIPTTTMRIEPQLKEESSQVLEDLGLTLSGAVTIFLKAVVREQGLPFEVKKETSNADKVIRIKDLRPQDVRGDRYTLHRGNVLDAYPDWEAPDLIVSDGAYGVRGFRGDTVSADGLVDWYAPHVPNGRNGRNLRPRCGSGTPRSAGPRCIRCWRRTAGSTCNWSLGTRGCRISRAT